MEYLLIVGFVAAMITPLMIIFYFHTQNSVEDISQSQLNTLLRQVVDASESVYYQGEPSQMTMKIYLPPQLASAVLANKEIVLGIKTSQGILEMAQPSVVNLTGNFPQSSGIYTLTIKAQKSYVNISYR